MKTLLLKLSALSTVLLVLSLSFAAAQANVEKDPKADVLKNYDVYPMAENGLDLTSTLSELITYPQDAVENGLEGVVKVMCMVEKDGSVSSVVIVEDIGCNCADQVCKALRSVKLKPATHNGEPRRCPMLVQVRFDLE
ncbi:MAG: energy transducer TonB [Bacteroidales bacterium]|nr:energy transducer TonB [Bacteroidales bacterium]